MEQTLERTLRTLKGVYETPEEYTYVALVSFEPLIYKSGQPIEVTLTFEDDRSIKAKIDNEYCVEFNVLINHALYDVTVAEIWDEYIIFDYAIRNETKLYELATSQSLMLPASYEYKVNTKLVYEIIGEIVEVRDLSFECTLYSFDDDFLYKGIVIYDEMLRKTVNFQKGKYVRMVVLCHETSLSVLSVEYIEKVEKESDANIISYTDNSKMMSDESVFISTMLFAQQKNENYILKLKYINEGEQFAGKFKTYFELFSHINRTRTREELSLKNKKDIVWNIGRTNDKCEMVSQWNLSMDNDVIFHKYYGNFDCSLKNSEFGQIYSKLNEGVKEYYVYLGLAYMTKYKFIKLSFDANGNKEIDMDYEVEQEKFISMHRVTCDVPEVVLTITNKLSMEPHNYFYWMFYWKSLSRSGYNERNKRMMEIIVKEQGEG